MLSARLTECLSDIRLGSANPLAQQIRCPLQDHLHLHWACKPACIVAFSGAGRAEQTKRKIFFSLLHDGLGNPNKIEVRIQQCGRKLLRLTLDYSFAAHQLFLAVNDLAERTVIAANDVGDPCGV